MNCFPNDWIAPNEFRYCNCKKYLLERGEKLCSMCKTKRFSSEDALRRKEIEKKMIRLAADRKNSGVPPLFWAFDP